jgi:hypothetical protein
MRTTLGTCMRMCLSAPSVAINVLRRLYPQRRRYELSHQLVVPSKSAAWPRFLLNFFPFFPVNRGGSRTKFIVEF